MVSFTFLPHSYSGAARSTLFPFLINPAMNSLENNTQQELIIKNVASICTRENRILILFVLEHLLGQ